MNKNFEKAKLGAKQVAENVVCAGETVIGYGIGNAIMLPVLTAVSAVRIMSTIAEEIADDAKIIAEVNIAMAPVAASNFKEINQKFKVMADRLNNMYEMNGNVVYVDND